MAYWAIVARRLAYPAYFQSKAILGEETDASEAKQDFFWVVEEVMSHESSGEKQEEMLQNLCRCIRGFISQSIGDSACAESGIGRRTFVPMTAFDRLCVMSPGNYYIC